MTGNREFRDDIVRIASLTVTNYLIEGYTFINCQIVGPAVLALLGNVDMSHCTYEADINSIFWEIDPDTRPVIFGAVGVQAVTFSQCSFKAIGFAGPRSLKELMEAAVS